MSIETTISPAIDYSMKCFSHSSIRYSRILPMSGSQAPVVSVGSTTTVSFEIPSVAFNFAQSKMCFSVILTPAAGVVQCNADPLAMFDRVHLQTRAGLTMCDIPTLAHYSKMTSAVSTPLETFTQLSGGLASYAVDGTAVTGFNDVSLAMRNPVCGLQPCRVLASGNPRLDAIAGCQAFSEPRYLFRSACLLVTRSGYGRPPERCLITSQLL
jgi:hypothetical protein